MTQENEMAAGAALPGGQEGRLFTQAELEGILRERLERERSKYADYEQLREKAAAFDAAQGTESEEVQKANERAEALQKQLDEMGKSAFIWRTALSIIENAALIGVPVPKGLVDKLEQLKEQNDSQK